MDAFWPFLMFLPFYFMIVLQGRGRSCPDCGAPLSSLQSPLKKTPRMWCEGGYLCARCGCESDANGRKVMPGGPPPRASLIRGLSLILALFVPAVLFSLLTFLRR